MILILGPCVVESPRVMHEIAHVVKDIAVRYPHVRVFFKASYDKANRTSLKGPRGPGLEQGLRLFEEVRTQYGLALLTDVHETSEVSDVASVVDVLQIPALLCRQTSLIQKAAATGKINNIKKGQFMAPHNMHHVVEKARLQGPSDVWLTERGTCFGYQQLVVDYRSLVWMRPYAPVIFDATHVVQIPQGGDGRSDGLREFIPHLARAAVAVGVDGLFLETHPRPDEALSDGPNACPLYKLPMLIDQLMELHAWSKDNITITME